MIKIKSLFGSLITFTLLISPLSAIEVNITEGLPYVDVDVNGKPIRIQQNTNSQTLILKLPDQLLPFPFSLSNPLRA